MSSFTPPQHLIVEEKLDVNLLPPDFFGFSENQVNEDADVNVLPVSVGNSKANKIKNKYRNTYKYEPTKEQSKDERKEKVLHLCTFNSLLRKYKLFFISSHS